MQMWQVSILLANADKVSDAVKQELKSPGSLGAPAPANVGEPKHR